MKKLTSTFVILTSLLIFNSCSNDEVKEVSKTPPEETSEDKKSREEIFEQANKSVKEAIKSNTSRY